MAIVMREALLILQQEPKRQRRLSKLIAFTHQQMRLRGERNASRTRIIPYIIGDNARTMPRLRGAGSRLRYSGNRPPTVPAGTARLRISLMLNVGEDEVRAMLDALAEEARGWSR